MAVVDLFGTPQLLPAPARRRGLTATVGVTGFLISIAIFTIAAVVGFAHGWQAAPRVVEGVSMFNFIDPVVHLGWGLASAALYALISMAAVASVVLLAILIHHRGHRTSCLPGRNEAAHIDPRQQSSERPPSVLNARPSRRPR